MKGCIPAYIFHISTCFTRFHTFQAHSHFTLTHEIACYENQVVTFWLITRSKQFLKRKIMSKKITGMANLDDIAHPPN